MSATQSPPISPSTGETDRRRRRMLILLIFLLLLIVLLTSILIIYLINPAPLPDLLPFGDVDYEPHYLFSIYDVDQPFGVALSPDEDIIYVTESGGERLVKMFDRDGNAIGSFAAAGSTPSSRSPVYIATDPDGRVLVTDRLQHGIYVFDERGNYLDTVLDPNDTLREYVEASACRIAEGTVFSFNAYEGFVRCAPPGAEERALDMPLVDAWSPLGIRVDQTGSVLVTDLLADNHSVLVDSGDSTSDPALWSLQRLTSGSTGQASDQLLFPNVAVADSQGRVYVTDGNNGRVSVWSPSGSHLGTVGTGSGEGALSLPRGAFVNERDRLFVVDAVGQQVLVYDVSGDSPGFLYSFGDEGIEDGQFLFPGDIVVDGSGRLYITDRENNRVQVWSY